LPAKLRIEILEAGRDTAERRAPHFYTAPEHFACSSLAFFIELCDTLNTARKIALSDGRSAGARELRKGKLRCLFMFQPFGAKWEAGPTIPA
jgi:hypothetical protein